MLGRLYEEPELREGEVIGRRVDTFLEMDGTGWDWTVNGQLILTNQRLVWVPLRFAPLRRIDAQYLEFGEIHQCTVGPRGGHISRPFVVRTEAHTFRFYLGGNPYHVLVTSKPQREWQAWTEEMRQKYRLG